MRLSDSGLQNRRQWLDKGYELPCYDRAAVCARTLQAPTWLHFGAGNIFRAFPAALQQSLLDTGLCDKGIIVRETFDRELIDAVYRAYDNLSVLVTLKPMVRWRKRLSAVWCRPFRHPTKLRQTGTPLSRLMQTLRALCVPLRSSPGKRRPVCSREQSYPCQMQQIRRAA